MTFQLPDNRYIVHSRLSIAGAAFRLPGCRSLDALERLLFRSGDAVTEIPDGRWTKSRFYDPRPGEAGKSYTFAAGCIPDIELFDAAFFGLSPREASQIDPQQRLLLELVQEALEDAGLPAGRLAGRNVGVYVGGSSYEFALKNAGDVAASDTATMQGAALSSLSNRISYTYNLRGPSLTVDTACSSAMVALHLAGAALARGEVDIAIVGGVNLLLAPQAFVGFARASMLSRKGRCHAFDARADGYVRAEGGGILILMRTADAVADGMRPLAEICATAVNSDGSTHGFSLPSVSAQSGLLAQIYGANCIAPDALGYFEAHGTGTPVGDAIEAQAIGAQIGRKRQGRLPIGSVKSNLGHLEAASGMAAIAKALIVLRTGRIPRSLHNETPNPNIAFDDLGIELVAAERPLPADGLIGINSFGFGGTNAHAVFAKAVLPSAEPEKSADVLPLLLSARSLPALRDLAQSWRTHLSEDCNVASVLRGAARARDHHQHRAVVQAGGLPDLFAGLDALRDGENASQLTVGEAAAGDLAFVFSGNGSQWVGMGREAVAGSPGFRAALAEVDRALTPHLGWSPAALLETAGANHLHDTGIAQPLLFAIQATLVTALEKLGIRPAMVMGHSAGEAAAAFASRAVTLDQACRIIAVRSRHQRQTRGAGCMLALRMPQAGEGLSGIDPHLEISAINSRDWITVAGPGDSIDRLAAHAAEQGWRTAPLDLQYAFHSRAMDPIRAGVVRDLADQVSARPIIPFVSTVTGLPVSEGLDADYWWRNVREPVRFADAAEWMIANGARIFLEIGPRPVLVSYLREMLKATHARAHVVSTLSREPISGDAVVAIAARCHVAGASIAPSPLFDGPYQARGLPGTAWQREVYAPKVTMEAVPLLAPTRDHPVLGFRDGREPGSWWNHMSTACLPWLGDHVVGGQVVLPAAVMIDMALSAAATLHPKAATLEIHGLEIGHFMPLNDGTRTTRFSVAPDGGFVLSSFPRMEDAAVTRHATGRLMPGGNPMKRTIVDHRAGEVIAAEEIYSAADAMGLRYGPAFRTVRRVSVADGDSADADLAQEWIQPAAEGWKVDPTLLDGALQALLVFSLRSGAERGAFVPWRFGRIVLHDPSGIAPSRARLAIRRRGPRSLAADVTLTGPDGRVLLELLDCWFVRFAPLTQRAPSLFRQILLPATGQPAHNPIVPPLPEPAPRPASAVLADAFLALAVRKGLAARDPVLPMTAALQAWRARFDAAPAAMPEIDTLWRTIFYSGRTSAAESVIASAIADSIQSGKDLTPVLQVSPVLLDQMLSASATARAAHAALEARVTAWLAMAGPVLRVALVGYWDAGAARRLADLLERQEHSVRLEIFCDDAARAHLLTQLFEDRPQILIHAGADGDVHRFDLVVGIWAMGGLHARKPLAVADMLAPGGALIAVEALDGGLAALLRLGGIWNPDGLDAATAAAKLADHGLAVSACVPLGSEIWQAALFTAVAQDLAAQAAPPPATPLVLSPLDHPWREALARRVDARWHSLHEARPFEAGADVLLLLPVLELLDNLNGLASLISRIATICVALETVGGARLTLAVRAGRSGDILGAILSGIRRVAANETRQLSINLLRLDPSLEADGAADAIVRELSARDGEPDLLIGPEGRLAPRLVSGLPNQDAPESAALRLSVDRFGLLSSLVWTRFDPAPLADDEIAIDVQAAGLNFRDVMWTLGMLPDEALLDGFSGPALGLECAGTVRAVGAGVTDLTPGDRVAALAPSALATVAVTRRDAVLKLGDEDFALAAGMPVAFMTAIYTLGHLARIAPGESVLIHGGAGGVGLAAIQYALHRGAIVYATAGDAARRRMLKRLGVRDAFDSRSVAFFDALLAATDGKGVDVVLNSLAGPLMEHSLNLLKPFGRFIEIGKRDVYMDSRIGLRALRRNASYFVADLDEMARARPAAAAAVLAEMNTLLAEGHIRPLPVRGFGFSEAPAAFRLMQSGGHIGKIVLERNAVRQAVSTPPLVLSPDAVYVVTGGVSGFGLETARFLAARGARRLALISRRGSMSPGAAEVIAAFATMGASATIHGCDVADRRALARTLHEVRALGPIRGIVHAAMVLDDARLAEQDQARLERVLAPKLGGALALDALTKDDPLDFFLLFSSITTAIGNPGQVNYVAANAGLEALAERRRQQGRPGVAIQFGPIADAGYLARETRIADMLATALGSRHMTAAQALDAVPAILASGVAVAGVAAVQWGVPAHLLLRVATPLMDHLQKSGDVARSADDAASRLAALPHEEAVGEAIVILSEELARVLHLPPGGIAPERLMGEFGIDSLMTVELTVALEGRLGCALPALALGEQSTLQSVAASLVRAVTGRKSVAASHAVVLRHEVLAQDDAPALGKEAAE